MTTVVFFSVIAIVIVVCLFVLVSRLDTGRAAGIQPIDAQCFARLLDDSDEPLIQAHLSRTAYKRARRLRVRAAIAYTKRAQSNATVLIRIGKSMCGVGDKLSRAQGERLTQLAFALRTQAAAALWRFRLALIFPEIPLRNAGLSRGWSEIETVFTENPGVANYRFG